MTSSYNKFILKAYDDAVNNILSAKNKSDLEESLWSPFYELGAECKKDCGENINILLINAPCNGFGDLIFALKLSKYLVEWYGANVTLATTFEKGLLNLGADPKYVVGLVGGKSTQCRRFKYLSLNKTLPKQDLILIAPIQIDFDHSLKDVQHLVPYANELNTFSFSEYNDEMDKNFTFNTGIGCVKGVCRDGLLLTKVRKMESKPKGLKNPFALIYVASSLDDVDRCILSFVEMISKKYYNKHEKLDIVCPPWFAKEDLDDKLEKKVSKYYPNIKIVTKDEDHIWVTEGDELDNTLTFRCDILPVPNEEMLRLMVKSVDDILLTGDQSITDAFSCCPKKNIFYQIAPWKEDLGKQLAKEMPNVYLKSVKTSCGTIKAINYKGNYEKFVKKWDFRTRAKPKLDAIMISTIAIQSDNDYADLADIISNNKTLASIKKQIRILKDDDSEKTSSNRSGKKYKPCKSHQYRDPVTNRCRNKDSEKKSRRRRSGKKSRRRRSGKKSRRRRSGKQCKYGVKKDGNCKKKPGPKKK